MIFVTFYLVFLNDNSSVLIRTAVVDLILQLDIV